MFPFDLHVLSTPPAFILSQDQTLMFKSLILASSKLAYPETYCFLGLFCSLNFFLND